MPAKTIMRNNLVVVESKQQSPRSPLEIDRVGDRDRLPELPMNKKVSFTSEGIPSGTQHTEKTVSTIREEREEYYDCDQQIDYDSDAEHSDADHDGEDDIITPMRMEDKTIVTTTSRNRRRRKIRWSSQVRVQEIRHINNMTEKEIEAQWMAPEEFKTIKNDAKTTVLMMMAGETFHEDDPDFCARGLEFRTRKGNKIRSANKLKARSAVLNEQDLQREEGFHDPEFIAMASLDISFECREQAQKRGEKDAEAITDYTSEVRALFSL